MSVTREDGELLVQRFKDTLTERGIRIVGAWLTGSLATADTGEDADCLLYVEPDDLHAVQEYMMQNFDPCSSGSYGLTCERSVWRSGDLNVILAHTYNEYMCWAVALHFMLDHFLAMDAPLPKELRVRLHQLARGEHLV